MLGISKALCTISPRKRFGAADTRAECKKVRQRRLSGAEVAGDGPRGAPRRIPDADRRPLVPVLPANQMARRASTRFDPISNRCAYREDDAYVTACPGSIAQSSPPKSGRAAPSRVGPSTSNASLILVANIANDKGGTMHALQAHLALFDISQIVLGSL